MTTIKLKNGSGAPLTGDLVQGEPALDLTNKRLYTEDSGGTVIEVGTNPTSLTTGTFTSTGIDDNAASTAITIDGSQNVGINNSNPSAYGKFVVDGTGNILNVNATSGSALLQLYEGGAGRFGIQTLDGSAGAKFTTAGTEVMRIDSSGNLLVGKTSANGGTDGFEARATGEAHVTSNLSTGALFVRERNTGNSGSRKVLIVTGGTYNSVDNTSDLIEFRRGDSTAVGTIQRSGSNSVSYVTSSDHRLKENVVAMTGATTRLKQLAPKRFNFIEDADTTVDGFLAHEVQSVVPEAITGTKDAMRDEEYEVTPAVYEDVVIPAVFDEEGNEVEAERTEQQLVSEAVMGTRSVPDYQGIDQSKLVPLLVATIQELEARITALESN